MDEVGTKFGSERPRQGPGLWFFSIAGVLHLLISGLLYAGLFMGMASVLAVTSSGPIKVNPIELLPWWASFCVHGLGVLQSPGMIFTKYLPIFQTDPFPFSPVSIVISAGVYGFEAQLIAQAIFLFSEARANFEEHRKGRLHVKSEKAVFPEKMVCPNCDESISFPEEARKYAANPCPKCGFLISGKG